MHAQQYPRPIIRWAGSKRQLLPALIRSRPDQYDRYVEPFAGSACLFLALNPDSAVLGDFNGQLIEVYRVMRRSPIKLADALRQLPTSDDFYYEMRSRNPLEMAQFDRVVRFMYLNRFCFNGVYRTNMKGEFNVPRGSKTGSIPPTKDFRYQASCLRKAELFACDFADCLSEARANDFVYIDPPYVKKGRRPKGEYGYGAFNCEDMNRLFTAIDGLNEIGAYVLLSYAYDEDVINRFDDNWHIQQVTARRSVAGFNNKRATVGEVLISNYRRTMPEAQHGW